jgi:hypothetical protein
MGLSVIDTAATYLPWLGLNCGVLLTICSLTCRLGQRALSIGVDLTCVSVMLLLVQFRG